MTLRSLLLLSGIVLATAALPQACFSVAQQEDLSPLAGCVALTKQRIVIGTSDARGQLCLKQPADTILLECTGRLRLWIAVNDAVRPGLVLLAAASRELEVLAIEPWPTARERQSLATYSTPDSSTLHGFERSSLRSALVWVPGVQMDQRGLGGSTRLSIRGSLLRSPYGVRGVKAYWGPFTLTLADGSTPLELLDPSMVNEIDVVRSVGSPVFGTAPSGLLLARPFQPEAPGNTIGAELTGGPDGFYRMVAQASTANGRNALSTGLVKQGNDGYRQQEWTSREQGWLVNTIRRGRSITRTYLTGQHATWALPGSVDSLTAYTDPRAPRPYSQQVNAHVEKTQVLAGLHSEYDLGNGLRVRTGVQAQYIEKLNPYGTSAANCGYKDETILATGIRLELAGDHRFSELRLAWQAGLEALFEKDRLNERTYLEGVIGDVRTNADSRVGNLNGFAALQARLGRFTLATAVGSERTVVEHADLLRDTTLNTSSAPVLFPSIGLNADVGHGILVHARYASSVARPTLWEQLGTAGVFNIDLKAERVSEVEAGVSIGGDTALFPFSAVMYWRNTDGLIVPQTASNGVDQFYVNAGTAHQNGFELTMGVNGRTALGNWIRIDGFCAIQEHTVQVVALDQERPVPGVPGGTAGVKGSIRSPFGPSAELGYRYVSEVPAALASNTMIPASELVHLRGSWTFRWPGSSLTAFLHVDNLLDQRYTAFVQVNDPGGRYYNPAPGRSFFAGCSFTWGAPEREH